MAKPIIKFKVNQQSAEVGGKLYGIVQDTPVTPENSILQICEFKKITAFTPEQVLRLVEDVCDGAAKLVARDGLSRQLSSLLKFSPRVRGTFSSVDARWTDQKLIVGARLLKDIKLDMKPSDFVMSNVADVGLLTSAAVISDSLFESLPIGADAAIDEGSIAVRINGSKLESWDSSNTFVKLIPTYSDDSTSGGSQTLTLSDFAANGFTATLEVSSATTVAQLLGGTPSADADLVSIQVAIFHPESDVEFKRLSLAI